MSKSSIKKIFIRISLALVFGIGIQKAGNGSILEVEVFKGGIMSQNMLELQIIHYGMIRI